MFFLLLYASEFDNAPELECHTLLDDNKKLYIVIQEPSKDNPYEIINTTYDAIDLLCEYAILIKTVSILISWGEKKDLHYINELYQLEIENSYKNNTTFNDLEETNINLYLNLKSHLINGEVFKKYDENINPNKNDNFGEKSNLECIKEKNIHLGLPNKIYSKDFIDVFTSNENRIIVVHFFKNKKYSHDYLVKEFGYLCKNVRTDGMKIKIDVATKFYLSIYYKNTKRKEFLRNEVKNQKFIGRTSMNIVDTFLCTNLCNIQKNNLVLDPCAGSGSLLIAAALRGANIIATDLFLNEMVGNLTGKTKTKRLGYNVEHNFFNLNFIGAAVTDCGDAIMSVDSIITDLPYGIRIAINQNDKTDIIDKIKILAKRVLKKGGVLGFWTINEGDIKIDGFNKKLEYVDKKFSFIRRFLVFVKL